MADYPFDIGKTIREMFPEQTKTPLRLFLWTVILLVDIAVVFLAAHLLGFNILAATNRKVLFLYLVIAFILWLIEGHVCSKIRGDC